MTALVAGGIDIVPPLAWSEVAPTGFMVKDAGGVPVMAPGRMVALVPTETLLDRPEGTLHRYLFARLEAVTPEPPDRAVFVAQLIETIAAFPTHVFGGTDRGMRFRGDLLDDQWRVVLAADGTVKQQDASLTWVNV
jgi:hypothetical protein